MVEYLFLSEAALESGFSESKLIRLGIAGKLSFFVQPKNWVYCKHHTPHISVRVNDPVSLDAGYLTEIFNGVNCVMYFSDEFPECVLEDLDDEPIQDDNAEYVAAPFGWKIDYDRLMVLVADLEQLGETKSTKLIKPPERQDGWFEAINDAVESFYNEFRKLPNEYQLWGRLCTNPPAGYTISSGTDKGGEDCLNMPGERSLSRNGFGKRWKSYTANNDQ